jgi:hypothetical protein
MNGVFDLEEGQELLTVALPRKLYDRIKAHSKPRQVIRDALKAPRTNVRRFSTGSGPFSWLMFRWSWIPERRRALSGKAVQPSPLEKMTGPYDSAGALPA